LNKANNITIWSHGNKSTFAAQPQAGHGAVGWSARTATNYAGSYPLRQNWQAWKKTMVDKANHVRSISAAQGSTNYEPSKIAAPPPRFVLEAVDIPPWGQVLGGVELEWASGFVLG